MPSIQTLSIMSLLDMASTMIRHCQMQGPVWSSVIVGHAYDLRGVQALVLEIEGSVRRPDGWIYHITWSLDRAAGRKPVESNAVLRSGWLREEPVQIELIPRFFC
jgi:hypothetical protein